jgi:hypothetical protein
MTTCILSFPRVVTGCVLRFQTSRWSSTLACAPLYMMATPISFSIISESRLWCARPEFSLPRLVALALTRIVLLFTQVSSLNTKFSAQFASQSFATYTVNGKAAGLYKNAGTFSYLRVFGAGHEVPAYEWQGVPRGAAALQMFTQIMSNHSLSST